MHSKQDWEGVSWRLQDFHFKVFRHDKSGFKKCQILKWPIARLLAAVKKTEGNIDPRSLCGDWRSGGVDDACDICNKSTPELRQNNELHTLNLLPGKC